MPGVLCRIWWFLYTAIDGLFVWCQDCIKYSFVVLSYHVHHTTVIIPMFTSWTHCWWSDQIHILCADLDNLKTNMLMLFTPCIWNIQLSHIMLFMPCIWNIQLIHIMLFMPCIWNIQLIHIMLFMPCIWNIQLSHMTCIWHYNGVIGQ